MSDGRGDIFMLGGNMPRNKKESIIFTLITAWMMVYVMTLYNIVLSSKSFTNITFLIALKGMWMEYIIIFLCAFFLSSNIAKKCAFKVVKENDRPIFKIIIIQVFTVLFQVLFASILGTIKGYGLTSNFLCNYLITYCKNFMLALPLQIFIVGPLARKIFRIIIYKCDK